jgi:plastocyanin
MPNTFNPTTAEQARFWRWAVVLAVGVIVAASIYALRAEVMKQDSESHIVLIQNMRFTPAIIDVRIGDRVIFRNEDLVPHTATSANNRNFDSGTIEAGATWSLRCARETRMEYRCTFHPTMTGSIIVKAVD